MSRAITKDNLFKVLEEYETRIARLESALYQRGTTQRVFEVTTASSVDLGVLDGSNITGVRVRFNGRVFITGTQHFMRLQPNGITSGLNTQPLVHRVGWDGAAASADWGLTQNPVSGAGLIVGMTDWVSGSGAQNFLSFEGMFFTSLSANSYRRWIGSYVNEDNTSDDRREEFARIAITWRDQTTVVNSLKLAIDGGATFTGRVSVEVVL